MYNLSIFPSAKYDVLLELNSSIFSVSFSTTVIEEFELEVESFPPVLTASLLSPGTAMFISNFGDEVEDL